MTPCGEIVPKAVNTPCGYVGPIGWCSGPKGHDGPHEAGRRNCNRPAGHDGLHRITNRAGQVLAEWGPKRIQLHRIKGWRKPPGAVVVARPSRWGNPWPVGPNVPAEVAVARFRADIESLIDSVPAVAAEYLAPLRGHDLACWCPLDRPCHADVLLEVANA